MANNEEKVEETKKVEETVVADGAKKDDTNQKRLDALNARKAQLQSEYERVAQSAQNTRNTIEDLNNRLTRQNEALNIFNAKMVQMEDEYSAINAEINSLTESK